MTPEEYCREKAGARGSSFYYSTLFVPPPARAALTVLQAYGNELTEGVRECQEAATARLKLAWWADELARTFAGAPRHPVGQALAPIIERYALPMEELHALIEALDADLGRGPYRSFDELHSHCRRLGTDVALGARVLGGVEPETLERVRELGAALRLADLVRDAGLHARRNRIYFPTEDLERFEVNVSEILQGVEGARLEELVRHQLTRTQALLGNALERLSPSPSGRPLPALTLARIQYATLEEIRRGGCRVLREHTTLPGWRKLWIAWRTARRERRRPQP